MMSLKRVVTPHIGLERHILIMISFVQVQFLVFAAL